MADQRDALTPLKTQIDGLLKKEANLRQIATGFTGIEADHVFWMDLLAEVRGAFASDAVWLTDFEPIQGFDPAAALLPKTGPVKTQNGKSVIKGDFATAQYGTSSILEAKTPPVVVQQRGKPAPATPAVLTANAVRIKGFWRENPKSQNAVSDLLKTLSQKSTCFRFSIPDPSDPKKTTDLVGDQNLGKILTIDSVPAKPGDLGMSFEITLPLTREVAIK
jgi:hypothetical protein